jgi:hypothetical protein
MIVIAGLGQQNSEGTAQTKTPHATLGGFARGAWAVIV